MKDLPTVAFGVPTIEAPLARVGVPSMCENSVRKLKSLKDDYFHNWIENF